MAGPSVKCLRLSGMPVLAMLQLEEALLRATSCNWFLVNDGAPEPSVVMGISGQVPDLVHADHAYQQGLRVIKRFTGGGTVVVDKDTIFTSLILREGAIQGLECFPVPIMRWTEQFYKPVFQQHGDFQLQEHDYCFGKHKFGGNAQAITNKRWLHHTSFLWDYDQQNMLALKNPKKQPQYREGRDHGSFVVKLKDYIQSRQQFLHDLQSNATQQFALQDASLHEASEALSKEYLRGNKVIDLGPYLSSGFDVTNKLPS